MKKLKFKATSHCVVVEVKKVKDISDGGIALIKDLVDREQMSTTNGLLVDIGPTAFDFLDEKDKLKEGDYVYFKKHAGISHNIDDQEYRVIHDVDIYAFERKNEVNHD